MSRKKLCDNSCGNELITGRYGDSEDETEPGWYTVHRDEVSYMKDTPENPEVESELEVVNHEEFYEFCSTTCIAEYFK